MKNIGFFNNLFFLASLQASPSYSGTIGPSSLPWQPVISIGGGLSSVFSLGKSQSFPIVNPTTDMFFNYTGPANNQTASLWDVFLSAEHPIYHDWLIQIGIAYSQAGRFQPKGELYQGVSVISADYYHEQFNISTNQLLAEAKILYPYHHKMNPYVLLGLGGSFNKVYHYTTSVPPFLTFTRMYGDKTTSGFAFRVGLGIDANINQQIRVGLGYRFADLGPIQFGAATIDEIKVPGSLFNNHLYANELLIQLSYTYST